MYGLYGATVSSLLEHYTGADVPWWVCAVVTMAIVQVLGAVGIEMGAKVLAVFVLAEFSILAVFALVTLFKGGGPEGLGVTQSFSPGAALDGAPGVALMFAVASMIGFEATAIYGEEAREPRKTVPRATYLAVALVTGFFAFASWMLISSYGASKATDAAGKALEGGDSTAFVFAPIADLFGTWVNDVLPILLATSLFAGILAFHNSANRYLFSLSRDGLLPRRLSTLNRRHSPAVAGWVQTAIAVVLVVPFALAGKDPVLALFSWGSGVAVLGIMLLYLLTSLSVVVFFRRERLDTRPWNTLIAPALGALGMAGAIWLIMENFTTLIGGEQSTAICAGADCPGGPRRGSRDGTADPWQGGGRRLTRHRGRGRAAGPVPPPGPGGRPGSLPPRQAGRRQIRPPGRGSRRSGGGRSSGPTIAGTGRPGASTPCCAPAPRRRGRASHAPGMSSGW